MSPVLAALAGLLVFASAWELAGFQAPARVARMRRGLGARARGGQAGWVTRLGIARRIERAGLDGRVSVRSFLAAKAAGALAGALAFIAVAPVTPSRLAPALAGGLVVAGFLAPDAYAERAARRRRARLVAALPGALDLLAVGAAAGHAPAALFADVAAGTAGPLAAELAMTVADVDAGIPLSAALAALRRRTGAGEVAALGAALERSRRYGSPLAEQLHGQAATLRREERRRMEERAARAAPKIQLVIALVLVPSALLAIAAALVAHSDALFGAL